MYVLYTGMGNAMPFEIQLMTNFMDTFNKFSTSASHDSHRRQNDAVIDWCVQQEQGAISRTEINAIRYVLTESLRS